MQDFGIRDARHLVLKLHCRTLDQYLPTTTPLKAQPDEPFDRTLQPTSDPDEALTEGSSVPRRPDRPVAAYSRP